MIETIVYDSQKPWKNILIFWCVHWNETCWEKAINKVISMFENKIISLKSWKITFVPIANPKAFLENKRYIDVNLNRVFKKTSNPKNYEEKIANYLCELIDKNDILLDIHSTHSDDKPFVFLDYLDEKNTLLAKSCLVENIVVWWPEIYQNTTSSDSCAYAKSQNKVWVTLECWNHNKKESIEVWVKAILNILKTYEIIDKEAENLEKFNMIKVLKYITKTANWELTKNYNHLDKLQKDEIIWTYENGEKIVSNNNQYILLPFKDAQIWDEWFYLGEDFFEKNFTL